MKNLDVAIVVAGKIKKGRVSKDSIEELGINKTFPLSNFEFLGSGSEGHYLKASEITELEKKTDSNTLWVVDVHGGRNEDGTHSSQMIWGSNCQTADFFKLLTKPVNMCFISCYGGSAKNDVHHLPKGSTVIMLGPEYGQSLGLFAREQQIYMINAHLSNRYNNTKDINLYDYFIKALPHCYDGISIASHIADGVVSYTHTPFTEKTLKNYLSFETLGLHLANNCLPKYLDFLEKKLPNEYSKLPENPKIVLSSDEYNNGQVINHVKLQAKSQSFDRRLYAACCSGDINLIKEYCNEKNYSINQQHPGNGSAPLHWVLSGSMNSNKKEAFHFLCELYKQNGLSFDQRNDFGETVFHKALISLADTYIAYKNEPDDLPPAPDTDVFRFLCNQANIDKNATFTPRGATQLETPLSYSVKRGHKELVEILCKSGVDVTVEVDSKKPVDLTTDPEIRDILIKAEQAQKSSNPTLATHANLVMERRNSDGQKTIGFRI